MERQGAREVGDEAPQQRSLPTCFCLAYISLHSIVYCVFRPQKVFRFAVDSTAPSFARDRPAATKVLLIETGLEEQHSENRAGRIDAICGQTQCSQQMANSQPSHLPDYCGLADTQPERSGGFEV